MMDNLESYQVRSVVIITQVGIQTSGTEVISKV